MTPDRRLWPATARVAHASLADRTGLPLTDGEARSVALPLADLLTGPEGTRDRQLVQGEAFRTIDSQGDMAFGFAEKDGFCGWLPKAALGPALLPTHWVATPGTHLYEAPKVQRRVLAALPMGARVKVTGLRGTWAETSAGFLPLPHLMPLGQWRADPVDVACEFLHSPYLWGGNSRAGLDCSGLVQLAHGACGIQLPGDSDLQESAGQALAPDEALARGDLIFWRGHVALAVDDARLIHANGATMSVAYEPIAACADRILREGGGPVTARRRPGRPGC